jgi:hypothetical protein
MPSLIKWYQSNQTGAPQMTGQVGSLIAVLNACLVNGYNLRTLTSITRDGTVATAKADAGHGFREGDTVRIEGAAESPFNGDKRIRNVTTNGFQFDVPADAPAQATGTLTAKIAPLDWESPFAATGKAVYRSKDVTSARPFLRIDETPLAGDANYGRGARAVKAQMWEVLNDLDSGTGSCETLWRRAQNESATARPWVLVGDSKRFWLMVNWSESFPNRYIPYFFGDFPSFKPGDGYNCAIGGVYDLGYNWSEPSGSATDVVYSVGTAVGNNGIWVARGYTQLGGPMNAHWVAAPCRDGGVSMGTVGLPYPNPADNGIYVMPLMIQEQVGPALRGRLPGLLVPLHAIPAPQPWIYDGFVIDGSIRRLLVVNGSGSATRLAFDLTGPWE